VPSKRLPFFKVGKELKTLVNGGPTGEARPPLADDDDDDDDDDLEQHTNGEDNT